MNDHEIERIAAAFHQLRPDWPAKQLTTLLKTPSMVDRPRRDVVVALGWVACEAATANPYRVLEAGPWWRAASVLGDSVVLQCGPWCATCGRPKDRHVAADHDYEPPADRKRAPEAIRLMVEDAKGRKEPTRTPVDPEPPTTHDPRATVVREQLKEDAK